jgi:hypothetical protein
MQPCRKDTHIEGGLAAQFPGVMVVERREIELGDEIEEEEDEIVFRQSVSGRDRFLTALLGVP